MTRTPEHITQKFIDIREKFLWKNGKPKIKHSTLIADYEDGGLKDVGIDSKFSALKLTLFKRFCDGNEHPWEIIPQVFLFRGNFCTDVIALNMIK